MQVICGTLRENEKKDKKGNVMTKSESCETNRIVSYRIDEVVPNHYKIVSFFHSRFND